MATLVALIQALPQLLKLLNYVIKIIKKTDSEKRREALGKLDLAIEKANQTNDLRDLSKWLSRRL